ncbi:MAG: GatB/YqeY domain-containing protein, partial [Pseudomonadota bacterium]|nr:GatB/YqeY domain-containing protein [Pseudomonadota bacterium]
MRDQINEALKEAVKAKDSRKSSTLRLINAAIKDRDIAARSSDNTEGVS